MLITEEYLLLIHDDASGRPLVSTSFLEQIAAGGLLEDLSLLERIALDDGRWGQHGQVVVRDPEPTGNELLDDVLGLLAACPDRPQALIGALAKLKPARRTLEGLVAVGMLGWSHKERCGASPATRRPARRMDTKHEIRCRVGHVLVAGATPDPRTTALIGLLSVRHQASKVIGVPRGSGCRPRDVDRRAVQIAGGDWAATAVGRHIEGMTKALFAGPTFPVDEVAARW